MAKFGDMDFHGQGQTGYDPAKKKYIGTWVDSMSPTIMMMEGDFDPRTKTLTMYSKGTGPTASRMMPRWSRFTRTRKTGFSRCP